MLTQEVGHLRAQVQLGSQTNADISAERQLAMMNAATRYERKRSINHRHVYTAD